MRNGAAADTLGECILHLCLRLSDVPLDQIQPSACREFKSDPRLWAKFFSEPIHTCLRAENRGVTPGHRGLRACAQDDPQAAR